MNIHTLHNLQEAYLDVYDNLQLDEYYKRFPKELVWAKQEKIGNKKVRSRKKNERLNQRWWTMDDVRQDMTSPEDDPEFASVRRFSPSKSIAKSRANKNRPESEKRSRTVAPQSRFPNRLMRSDGQGIRDSYEYETYETILSYLLDEGYADCLGSAEIILENMSDGWVESILNEAIMDFQPFKHKRKRVESKVKELESRKSTIPSDLGFRNARLNRRIEAMKKVLGKKNKQIRDESEMKSYENVARGGFKHYDNPQSKYYSP